MRHETHSSLSISFSGYLPIAPSPLDTSFSVFVTGSSAEVCVETKAASIIKLVLRDADNKRGIRTGMKTSIFTLLSFSWLIINYNYSQGMLIFILQCKVPLVVGHLLGYQLENIV